MTFLPTEFRARLRPFLVGDKPWGKGCLGDESLPKMGKFNSEISWRSLLAPRVHLLLSGQHQLMLFRNGQAKESELLPGDMWFFPPGALEHEVFKCDCFYLGLVFHSEYVRLILVNHRENHREDLIRNRKYHHWPEVVPEAVKHQLEILKEISRMPDDAALLRNALESFWRLADHWMAGADFVGATQKGVRKAHSSWLKVLHYLYDYCDLPINRQTASAELGLSPNRIYVLCREFGQKGFQELLEERRIERAKNYLITSELKIESVATLCGYAGAPYFTRAFRKLTGIPPGRWRLQHSKIKNKKAGVRG